MTAVIYQNIHWSSFRIGQVSQKRYKSIFHYPCSSPVFYTGQNIQKRTNISFRRTSNANSGRKRMIGKAQNRKIKQYNTSRKRARVRGNCINIYPEWSFDDTRNLIGGMGGYRVYVFINRQKNLDGWS